MTRKNNAGRWSNSKHRWLGLVGGISLLIWGISGLTHIAMVLFGPQQAQFMPPASRPDLAEARPIAATLEAQGIDRALAVKTVAGPAEGSLWQVTVEEMAPRRYFRPDTGEEIADGDRQQAEFLARHFLASDTPLTGATLQTEFSPDYPWVNRLLPVWKLEFAGDDRLTAFVHTETSSLAAVNNGRKEMLQSVFRALHTWEWVPPGMDWLRVAVIAVMVGSLFALAATGIVMLIAVRRKVRMPGARGWHRRMGYVLALPLIMFSLSGIYHLVQAALVPPGSQLRMGDPVSLAAGGWPVERDWSALSAGRDIASVSLVAGGDGRPLYRLGLAPKMGGTGGGEHDHGSPAAKPAAEAAPDMHDHSAHMAAAPARIPQTDAEIRDARYAGIRPDGPAIYIDADTGDIAPDGERDMALAIAHRFSGAGEDAVTGAELVTRFSHEYDFRNKRLPVWRVDYGAPVNASLYVDTGAGVLVDRVEDWQKPERFVFSMIHKWNFLYPIGRLGLNVMVGLFAIALIGFMAVLGLRMDLTRRRRQQRG